MLNVDNASKNTLWLNVHDKPSSEEDAADANPGGAPHDDFVDFSFFFFFCVVFFFGRALFATSSCGELFLFFRPALVAWPALRIIEGTGVHPAKTCVSS